MASGALRDYFGRGVIADRPAAPDLYGGTLGFWFATDTGVLSVWDGSVWADIADTNLPIPGLEPTGGWQQGDMLFYDAGNSAFVAVPAGVPGQVLKLQSGEIPYWDDEAAAAVSSVNGQTGVVALSLEDLDDVMTQTGAPEVGDILVWNGSQWLAEQPGASAVSSVNGQTGAVELALGDLIDVLTGTGAPDDLDMLVWDASIGSWVGSSTAAVAANLQGSGLIVDAAGYRGLPQVSFSANVTIAATHNGKDLYHPASDANARTVTIDSNANLALPIGFTFSGFNRTSQAVSIAITSDTLILAGTGAAGTRSIAQYGSWVCRKQTATEWSISGVGIT